MMRQGQPVSDLCIYLGDDVPMRILSHRLPDLPQCYDFDAFTTDALLHRMTAKDGRICLPEQERIMWQTTPLAKPDDPLMPSGQAGELFVDENRSKFATH